MQTNLKCGKAFTVWPQRTKLLEQGNTKPFSWLAERRRWENRKIDCFFFAELRFADFIAEWLFSLFSFLKSYSSVKDFLPCALSFWFSVHSEAYRAAPPCHCLRSEAWQVSQPIKDRSTPVTTGEERYKTSCPVGSTLTQFVHLVPLGTRKDTLICHSKVLTGTYHGYPDSPSKEQLRSSGTCYQP